MRPFTLWCQHQMMRINEVDGMTSSRPHPLSGGNIQAIRQSTLQYVSSMRVLRNGKFLGYRFSQRTAEPLLYCTLAALLIKNLYGIKDESSGEELKRVLEYQGEDGIFRDKVIACHQAETEDWWGWRHLTLHALMTLALYDVPAAHELRYLDRFSDKDEFRRYLSSRDWGSRVAWTSNELQNIGVMLQYARDRQNCRKAGGLLEILYEVLAERQDPVTGLYGDAFDTPERLSFGVQAGYHFWLLLAYDKRPIRNMEAIIDNTIKTQNALGGYGVNWNSSACEDIDSIDPLVRFSLITDYRRSDIIASLLRALPAILHNLNEDGGWVFRRHEPLQVVHSQMVSAANESNLFYTWFRTLGLAYCLIGLGEKCPESLRFNWKIPGDAPGHQFI
jgi:hypothetical protein